MELGRWQQLGLGAGGGCTQCGEGQRTTVCSYDEEMLTVFYKYLSEQGVDWHSPH